MIHADIKFYYLLTGIVLLLSFASVVGYVCQPFVKSETAISTTENLIARVNSWWIMCIVFSAAIALGENATIIMFMLISFLAYREFVSLTPTNASDHKILFIGFFIIIPVQYYLIAIDWCQLFTIFIPVYMFLLLPSLAALQEDTEAFLERCAKIQWGIMITVYCISHVPALLLLKITNYSGKNSFLLFYFILIVQLSDVLQYVFGKLFGKTKIAPIVSPSKTIEGFLGGVISTTLIGASMWWITPFTPIQSAAMSFIIVLMGFLGGLSLSAVKRSLSVKDWGTMIRGHGGMMDRMDSVCFAAPIFFHLVHYFFT